jgi:hypothetical protein
MFKHQGQHYLLFAARPFGGGGGGYGAASTRYRASDNPLDWSGSHETVISPRSCEGQPSHVTPIPAPGGGMTYLYHSDIWWAGDGPRATIPEWRNQALANFHFEPLAFGPFGALRDISCAQRVALEVPGLPGQNSPIPHLDQTSADQLFHSFCDVGALSGQVQRLQVFRPTRSGRLSLYVTVFQRLRPDASLFVDVVRIQGNFPPEVLATHRPSPIPDQDPQVPHVKWSPRVHRLDTGVTVTAGLDYGFVLRAPLTTGCYGVAYSDAGVYPRGRQLYSNDGGGTWRLEAGRALKFAAAVAPLP